MKTITFHSGEYKTIAHYLFNDRKHLHLQSPDGWIFFNAVDESEHVLACISIHLENGIASSPRKAPFGSIEFVPNLAPKVLYDFISFILEEVKKIGAQKIFFKNPPASYNQSQQSLLTTFLLNHGFSVQRAEIGAVIPVTNANYTSLLSDWEKRKLKQAKLEELSFEETDTYQLSAIYTFIEKCRAGKGYKLSMSLAQLEALQNTFPNALKLFASRKQNELVAACIALEVSSNILYTFYYDHAEVFARCSPVVFLMEGVYSYCQHRSYTLLDLGTSNLAFQPNFGLLDFKLNLGGQPTSKFTFEKTLH